MNDERHPAEDLASLAAGLGAALSRRERAGHRHLSSLGDARVALPMAPNPDSGETPAPGGETAPAAEGFSPSGGSAPTPAAAPAPDPTPSSPTFAARPAPAPPPEAAAPPPGTVSAADQEAPTQKFDALARALPAAHAQVFLAKVAEVEAAARAAHDLEELRDAVASCRACRLCEGRTQTVFADGSAAARVMFVGEAPGVEEDRTGVPFVGRAGQLLSDIIAKGMRLERANDVYIANVVKCRPPENRDPNPHEKAICAGWLERQIELVDPRVVLTLGKHASGHLLESEDSLGRMRGRVHERAGRKIVPTYHPAWALRQQGAELAAAKGKIWADVQLAMAELEIAREADKTER